ncbi:hypothetical protein MKX08_008752 [Trichoderma sp. CBMAI-0020]|nr:hypothetical protein MKX08_008752 [Trichoderma sp. CBMAI-0020]
MSDIGELDLQLLNLDEPDQDEHLEAAFDDSIEVSEEERAWKSLELEEQCKDVLNLLSQNKRCWISDDGNLDIPLLEEYKKRTIAEKKGDINEPTRLTALHVLARSKREFYQLYEARKDAGMQLVGYLLENRAKDSADIQSSTGEKRMLVLQVALFYENDKFIDCIEQCLGSGFQDFLHLQDDNGKNCIHHLFSWPLERFGKKILPQKPMEENMLYLNQVRKLALKAKSQTLATADNEGNTPIHYAMHLKQCNDRGDDYADIVKILIVRADECMVKNKTLFNKKNESPVMYWRNVVIATREENTKAQQANQLKQKSAQSTKDQKDITQVQRPESRVDSQLEDSGPMKKSHKRANQSVSMNHPITLIGSSALTEEHRLQRSPTASTFMESTSNQRQNKTLPPGRKREPPMPSAQAKAGLNVEGTKVARRNAAPTVNTTTSRRATILLSDFLRAHYTETRSDLDARDLIWGRGAEGWATNLYFDARGIQETKKILELLDRMKAGGFGKTLAYVSIPAIRHVPVVPSLADNVDPRDRGMPFENPRPGRTDLIDVFNKLRQFKVTHILRLEVEDRQTPSHMDAAIEKAIQGRDSAEDQFSHQPIDIDTWDWRKPDLSTDVIAFAAPTVKIGLETMERMKTAIKRFKETLKEIFPQVEFVRPTSGRENKDRLKNLIRLEESLTGKFSKVVEIEFTYHTGDLFANVDAGEETSEYLEDDPAAKQHVWVDAMDKFRGALKSMLPLETLSPKHRVRVALIDDGVNLGSVDMYGGIVNVTGLSFHPSDRQTENPWHCSSGGHGTIMANMILRINPWVELFVIKLHCGVSHNQGRTISARSAAEAIRAAIALNVKIISVSWTIKDRGIVGTSPASSESGPPNSVKKDALTDLREAIDEVKKNGILMFCSASDDIQTTAMKALPYSQQPEHIFRIGAALWLGQRDPTTETPDRIDWYFPGNQVAEAQNPRLQGPVKYHDGSSAGTALAAGLASLIMYLARLAQARYNETNNVSEARIFERFAKGLEDRTKMKQALDMIGKNGNYQQDKKYLPVWSTFNPATEVLTQAKDAGPKWEELARLVKSLCLEHGV